MPGRQQNAGLAPVTSVLSPMPSPQAPAQAPLQPGAVPRGYRRYVLRLTLALLLVWAVVTFGVAYFARELSFDFFGWPFSFWVGAQGALIVYCLIVWLYARWMNQRDAQVVAQAEAEAGAGNQAPGA